MTIESNKHLVVFGDSYSTYDGFIPQNMQTYYPVFDVDSPEKTWWSLYCKKTGSTLIQNNSWSGLTIGYTGYENSDCSKTSSIIYRYKTLLNNNFFSENAVNKIIVFGGTNDSWSGAPLGKPKFSDWEEKDLYCVLPAISYIMYTMKKDLPNTEIIFIINTEIKSEIQDSLAESGEKFGVKTVKLKNVEKRNDHPTAAGMISICEQLFAVSQ